MARQIQTDGRMHAHMHMHQTAMSLFIASGIDKK